MKEDERNNETETKICKNKQINKLGKEKGK